MARRESSNIERAHLAARNAELEAETRSLRRRYQAAVREKERLERRVGAMEQTVSTLRAALAKAQAALRTLRHLHFGRSSERGAVPGTESAPIAFARAGSMFWRDCGGAPWEREGADCGDGVDLPGDATCRRTSARPTAGGYLTRRGRVGPLSA